MIRSLLALTAFTRGMTESAPRRHNRHRRLTGFAVTLLATLAASAALAQSAKVTLPTVAPRTGAPQPAPPAAVSPQAQEKTAPSSRVHGDIIGELHRTVTWNTDNLLDLARAENLGLLEILAANPGVDPWLPGAGTEILLPTAHILPSGPRTGIVINLAEQRIYYYDPKRGPMTFPIGVGREGFATPIGSTKIVRKQAAPTWYPTASRLAEDPPVPRVVPPGPDNPLGEFAMYLGWPAYLMHGTNKPDGVGRRVSHGCIRMYPEDIAFLFRVNSGQHARPHVSEPVKNQPKQRAIVYRGPSSLDQLDELEGIQGGKTRPLQDQTDRI
ncbi:MAG: L,D-transpeptidase family protein [Hyphomicrobiales bacterium]